MSTNPEKSIHKQTAGMAINDTIMEIESYLYFRQPRAVIELALDMLAKKHGEKAKKKVIQTMQLEDYLRG